MNERMRQRAVDLRARQKNNEPMVCPRCGRDNMRLPISTNALSRHLRNVYVCSHCGTAEAMLDFMKQKMPLSQWSVFRPVCPPSGFESLPAEEVLRTVMKEQKDQLVHAFRMCRDDPENTEEYRYEAFETCPGLTELWTDPFYVKYKAADGIVLIRFRTADDGTTELAADIVSG